MRPELGFEKTRVVKTKGYGKGRRGLIIEVDLLSGTWLVLFDDTKTTERAYPYEYENEKVFDKNLAR